MMYVNDIVLLADNENGSWCSINHMVINPIKSQIVHFRPRSIPCTNFTFTCGSNELVDEYVCMYLGITLTEFLDFNVTAKMVSQGAGRAFGLLIAKYKTLGGMPFDIYCKSSDAMVWPVIAFGAAVWGDRSYSCIEAIQNRAMRFFVGVGRYIPSAGVGGDMGLISPLIRQWESVCNVWSTYSMLPNARLNKRIFMYTYRCGNSRCKNWLFRIYQQTEYDRASD